MAKLMTTAEVAAAIEQIEGGPSPNYVIDRIEEAAEQAPRNGKFPSPQIYGSGGYHRFVVYRRGNLYELRLLRRSITDGVPSGRAALERCEALGVAIQ